MTNCWFCGSQMIWKNNIPFKDYGYFGADYGFSGEGIVAVLTCPNCHCTAEFSTAIEEDD